MGYPRLYNGPMQRRSFLSLAAYAALPGALAFSQRAPKREPDVWWEPSADEVVTAMLKMAKVKKGDIVYDLGCGDGRIVVTAAKKFGANPFTALAVVGALVYSATVAVIPGAEGATMTLKSFADAGGHLTFLGSSLDRVGYVG